MNILLLIGVFIRTWHWPSILIETDDQAGGMGSELRECAICHERAWYTILP